MVLNKNNEYSTNLLASIYTSQRDFRHRYFFFMSHHPSWFWHFVLFSSIWLPDIIEIQILYHVWLDFIAVTQVCKKKFLYFRSPRRRMLGLNPGLLHYFLDNPELVTTRLHFILFYFIFYRNLQAPVAVLRPAQSGHEVRTVSGRWGGHIRDSLRWLFEGNYVCKCRKCSNGAWTLRWSHSKFSPTIIPR